MNKNIQIKNELQKKKAERAQAEKEAEQAKAAGARIIGTGRSDFPNQVNNVIAFPGIFKGALEGRASQITEEMKLAAAIAIAGLVNEDDLHEDNIMPEAFNPEVAKVVANAVKNHIK